jgi:hypothetical protein
MTELMPLLKKGARGYDSEYYTGIFVALETPTLNQFNKI